MKHSQAQIILLFLFCVTVFFRDGTKQMFPNVEYVGDDGKCGFLGGCSEPQCYVLRESFLGEEIVRIPIAEVKLIKQSCDE